MKSAARISEHPIHPMLIPYPFAFLSGALGFRLLAKARGSRGLDQTADHLRTAGIGAGLLAAVPGIIDYFSVVPSGRPKTTATFHALSNVSGLVCFVSAVAAARQPGNRDRVAALESIGTAFLCVGGWLGGTLSYHHHVGVVDGQPEPHRLPVPETNLASEHRSKTEADMLQNVGP